MSKISCLLFLLNVFSCYSQQGTILTKVADRFRRHHNRYLDSFSDPRCDCQIPTNQHESDAIQPLFKKQPIWQNISFNLQFIYPAANENNLTSPTIRASIVQLVCGNDGNNLAFNSLPLTFISSAIVRCALLDNGTCTNRLFTPSNHYLLDFKSFSEITCTDKQVPEVHIPILPLPYYSCKLINITCLEIGFTVPWHISPLGFLPVLKSIAFDGAKLQPIVAHIFMPSSILHGQRDDGNHTFRRGSVFSSTRIDLKEVYQRDYQRKRLFDILGNQKLVDEYVPETGDSYLTEGQLISEQDLFYKVQKPSAFFYENTVPIWRSIATGNWELSGKFLRNLALDTGIGFLYYSGVIDTLELLDQEGNKKPIFLAQKQDGNPVIPVPKLLFKYVVGKRFRENILRALVVITVNDPRISIVDGDLVNRGYLIPNCNQKQICQTVHPEFLDPTKGYTYCCNSQEFAPYAKQLGLPNKNLSELIV